MSRNAESLLADAVIESITATTPSTRHSRARAYARRSTSLRTALAWLAVATAALLTLAIASGTGA
ncbi:MAG TPA: hypothetical protein VK439_15095 [Rubrivivax sp.]|nr:hypothetical protein [Rubrivivax sp.]